MDLSHIGLVFASLAKLEQLMMKHQTLQIILESASRATFTFRLVAVAAD